MSSTTKPLTAAQTALTVAEYGYQVARLCFWVVAFRLACLISSECRSFAADGKAIDPIDNAAERLDELHTRLFGGEDD
jgi:hypothetical protein